MSIRLDCPCGRTLTVADSYAHLKIQCPSCRESLTLPAADTNSPAAGGSQDAVQPDLQDIGKKWGSSQSRDEDYDYNSEDNPSPKGEMSINVSSNSLLPTVRGEDSARSTRELVADSS